MGIKHWYQSLKRTLRETAWIIWACQRHSSSEAGRAVGLLLTVTVAPQTAGQFHGVYFQLELLFGSTGDKVPPSTPGCVVRLGSCGSEFVCKNCFERLDIIWVGSVVFIPDENTFQPGACGQEKHVSQSHIRHRPRHYEHFVIKLMRPLICL